MKKKLLFILIAIVSIFLIKTILSNNETYRVETMKEFMDYIFAEELNKTKLVLDGKDKITLYTDKKNYEYIPRNVLEYYMMMEDVEPRMQNLNMVKDMVVEERFFKPRKFTYILQKGKAID